MKIKMAEPVKEQAPKLVGDSLATVFDVHYRNKKPGEEFGKWYRWMNSPEKDVADCRKWIANYNNGQDVCGIVRFEPEQMETEFRIVESQRKIVDIIRHSALTPPTQ